MKPLNGTLGLIVDLGLANKCFEHKEIFRFWLEGYKPVELATKYNVTSNYISVIVYRCLNILKKDKLFCQLLKERNDV